MNIQALPDKGQKLLKQIQELEEALGALALSPEPGKMGYAPELGVCGNFKRDIRQALSVKNLLLHLPVHLIIYFWAFQNDPCDL